MANPFSKQSPPLAGRPPFATDEPDSVYENSPSQQTRRIRQPRPEERPTSAYNVYENYTADEKHRQSGYGDLGSDLLNGDMDDDSDDDTIAYHGDIKKGSEEKLPPPPSASSFPSIPIMAPKPGYAAPVSALTMPEPSATPMGQQRSQQMIPQQNSSGKMFSSTPVPQAPHPLQPPMTPITPAFARPPKLEESGVKFDNETIMRGQREEVPLARRGQKGDDFWRRFSMVVKEEGNRKSTSSWLEKTQNGTANLSRLVWIIGILLLIIIAGAIGFGWYVSHNSTTTSSPKALGGSEGQGQDYTITPTAAGATGISSSRFVSPTNTVAKRWPMPEPTPAVMHAVHIHSVHVPMAANHAVDTSSNSSRRHRRSLKNRL